MNYLRKKCTQGGTTLLLSNDQEKLKQYVLTELKQMESLSIPCCIISYNEICDNKGDNIERTSDLNPFINVNIKDCIKDNHKGYLWMLVSCLLTIEYSRQMTDDENRKIKEVCDKLDFTKDIIIPLFWSDIRFIKRLDGPDSFLRYKDYYNISLLQWKYSKVITV